ncbi:hypothetical protein ACS0TY_003110 [Phlomoides rotata]
MNADHQIVAKLGNKKNSKGKRKSNDSLKVVYISSPMKVKTSASRFRSLVQQLTGKNSDITQYMDDNNHHGMTDFYDCDDVDLAKETSDPYQIYYNISSSISPYDTPTSSDSLTTGSGSMDNIMFTSQFDGIFSSSCFYNPSELDVLGSFDELL